MSPTQRSLERMRARGWKVEVVEKFNHYAKVRKDAFEFGDILAFHPQIRSIALIQTTSMSNFSTRRKKVAGLEAAKEWKEAGGEIILHGWNGSKLKELFL